MGTAVDGGSTLKRHRAGGERRQLKKSYAFYNSSISNREKRSQTGARETRAQCSDVLCTLSALPGVFHAPRLPSEAK